MATVEPFHRGMIETWVKSLKLPYLTDSDGDISLDWPAGDTIPCDLRFLFMAEGDPLGIYAIRIMSYKEYPREEWGRVLLACNEWNKLRRWPKAYLNVIDDTDDTAWIRLEYDLPLHEGVHQDLINDVSGAMLGGTFGFWEWAVKEQSL
jgi:hypothetical protein